MSKKHMKPLYWGLFSAGGTVAALALSPVVRGRGSSIGNRKQSRKEA